MEIVKSTLKHGYVRIGEEEGDNFESESFIVNTSILIK